MFDPDIITESIVKIREEAAQDIEHIGLVNEQAFAGVVEARLVNELRQNDKIVLSLVALVDGQLVGHILFSPMQIVSPAGKTHHAVGLGPVAVLPTYQQQGVGTALCQKGLAICREAGHRTVLVLGHPTYYPRFGFQPAALFEISCTYDVPADAFMALELQEGALDNVSGIAYYQPEFDRA